MYCLDQDSVQNTSSRSKKKAEEIGKNKGEKMRDVSVLLVACSVPLWNCAEHFPVVCTGN